MRNSLTKNLHVQPRKSTVILSSNDVITCYDIPDVTNFDLRTKNSRSVPCVLARLSIKLLCEIGFKIHMSTASLHMY